MHFWAYMLQCRGGYLYVGHTDDLARRLAQHESGEIAGFSRDHRPVVLVWSQEFDTRDQAKASEKQVNGWSRAKKLALIGGDWGKISDLAKKKGSPSTSSGKTEWGEPGWTERGDPGWTPDEEPTAQPVYRALVEGLPVLILPHPDTPPLAVTAVRAQITGITENWLTLRWSVAGAGRVIVPALAGKRRADGLWQHTCFELFLQVGDGDSYVELNLSPSEAWAAYDFTFYRQGMSKRAMPRPPDGTARRGGNRLIFDAAVPIAGLPPRPWRAGLTAVIEEEGGVKSYWAPAHSPGPPDFHNPACRTLSVPAPAGP